MKICYLSNGNSIHLEILANHFASSGHEVHLICWNERKGYNKSIHIHRLSGVIPTIIPGALYLNFIFWIIEARRLIKVIKPDIIDGHYITVYGFLAAWSGFHPLVVTAWGSDVLIQAKNNALWKFVAKYALKKADLIVCRSPVSAREISSLCGQVNRIHVILIGVDTDEFKPVQDSEKLREILGIAKSQPIIINIRSLAPIYDVKTMIKAIPLVLAKIPQAKFLIIRKPEQKKYSEKLLRGMDISSSIQFIDWIPHSELPKYLSLADVYVSTSLSDGASNSLFEAMACELAPVVTDIPANRPWIKGGENGFLFPAKDYETLASKIIYLINNDDINKCFGKKSRKIVQQKAEHRAEMDKLEKIYKELIGEKE